MCCSNGGFHGALFTELCVFRSSDSMSGDEDPSLQAQRESSAKSRKEAELADAPAAAAAAMLITPALPSQQPELGSAAADGPAKEYDAFDFILSQILVPGGSQPQQDGDLAAGSGLGSSAAPSPSPMSAACHPRAVVASPSYYPRAPEGNYFSNPKVPSLSGRSAAQCM